ncbi:hypothetical protein BU25DRAFT_166329 [Macroventuria anomochaeta]|uniref:Uncharacterized protein n=1 Tax=Macroventuria anomochaeta TaxID=301207 RepID=A0ACB6RT18_9PLEO|nr:uncharacterized protein BU25DRAFT_166329 [Macroventuria anomochaeta]KAF2624052.1 hypothetical protein BU25DRAFT_166329 [Macroventuria anomochaeta]
MDGENEDYDNDDYNDPSHLETYAYPDYLLYLVARATHRQRLRLSSLSSINPNAFSLRARTFVELAPALQSVQHLRISVNTSNATKLMRMNGSALYRHEIAQSTAVSFGQALSTLRNLRSLKLTFDDYYWEDDRNSNISRSLHSFHYRSSKHLTSVDIRLTSFQGQKLYGFLHKQRSTLQQPALRRITLTSVEHWRPILTLMLGEMSLLTRARCSELTGGEGFGDTTQSLNRTEGWKKCCIIDCFGRKGIMIGLK